MADQLREWRPDAVIDTRAMTAADASAVLPHLPDAHLVLLSSIDVYRAYELLLAGQGGEPVPLTESSALRTGRYPLRDLLPGLGEHYDKLDVEPLYLSRGGTALRLSLIYGEHDGQRREEFVLRRVRAGRLRIPFGPGTSLDTRCYVGDVASAVLAQPPAAELPNPSKRYVLASADQRVITRQRLKFRAQPKRSRQSGTEAMPRLSPAQQT